MGDNAVEFRVHVEVGIHQVKFHAAYVDAPYVAVDDAAGKRHFYNHRSAALVHNLLDGKLVEVLGFVVGNLLTVNAQRLSEVAETIEEADCGHGDAAVGCLLDVVSGENAKTTGVDLQAIA